jgi:REP-associated tyrosine transposase
MTVDNETRERRSVRLRGYDYSTAGRYFVTVCAHQRKCIFGEIADDQMRPNALGAIVREEWFRTAKVRAGVMLDAFVVMPNHIHGTLEILGGVGATPRVAQGRATQRVAPTRKMRPHGPGRNTLGAIIGQFKSVTAKRINEDRRTPGQPVWQRNYCEHVIRNEAALNKIRDYICANPGKWPLDRDNPARTSRDDNELEEILAADVGGLEGW